jgi:hypothetical protein
VGRDEASGDFTAGVVTTTSVTATIGRPPRKFYFLVQFFAFGVTVGVAFLAERCEIIFQELGMHDLPILSGVLLSLGRFLREPLGLSCVAAIVLGLGLLAFKGVLDGILKALIWLNVLWIVVVCAIYFLGRSLPLWQISSQLK